MRFLLESPWWLVLAVAGGLVGYVVWWFLTFERRLDRAIHKAVLEAGDVLKEAAVTVHAVTAVPRPDGPSPFDLDEDDENYQDDLDGRPWDEDGYHFYAIDATITPADPTATWDASALAVVPADFTPEDPADVCEQLGGLHSAERRVGDAFRPLKAGDVRGSQRLKMLFAVPAGVRAVKFANVVTYFGHVDLPAPVPPAGSRC